MNKKGKLSLIVYVKEISLMEFLYPENQILVEVQCKSYPKEINAQIYNQSLLKTTNLLLQLFLSDNLLRI